MILAGSMWAEHQEKNETEVTLFKGIKNIVEAFSARPHGICSQNSQNNIRRMLINNGIDAPFKAIVGYDDVSNDKQKPHQFGGIKCIESILGHLDNPFVCILVTMRRIQSLLATYKKLLVMALGLFLWQRHTAAVNQNYGIPSLTMLLTQ
ncbi:HAD family hydrolase [Vibrio wakamikoensis]|uniref:HAD family hydrolase n=1 Tax=Vibrio wakamikoensis TaxID=2910251 RepID=UPI003D22390D